MKVILLMLLYSLTFLSLTSCRDRDKDAHKIASQGNTGSSTSQGAPSPTGELGNASVSSSPSAQSHDGAGAAPSEGRVSPPTSPLPSKMDPPTKSLKLFLNEDHQDFLEKKIETLRKGEQSQFLKQLLEPGKSDPNHLPNKLEPLLRELLNMDVKRSLIAGFISEYEAFLAKQWESRKKFLENKNNIKKLGFSAPQLTVERQLTWEQYRQRGLEGLKRRYQEKAVIAFGAIGSSSAKQILQSFTTSDEGLRNIVEIQLRRLGVVIVD